MIPNNLKRLPSHQSGAATLLVSIVLLIGVTLITIFAARVGVMDQRIAGNEYRHKEAQAAADAALDQAASFISENTGLYDGASSTYSWVDCTTPSIASQFPCLDSSYELVYDPDISTTTIESLQDGGKGVTLASGIESQTYLTYTTSNSAGNILTAIGTGKSLDGTGDAYAQVSYTRIALLTPGKIPPIMTPSIGLSGSFTIVPDPNGGGPGIPISAWVTAVGAGVGSWQTCQLWGYRDGASGSGDICSETRNDSVTWKDCSCNPDEFMSSKADGANADIVVSDVADYPDSAFQYLFPNLTEYSNILDQPNVVEVFTCSGLDTLAATFTTSTVVAVSGPNDCSLPGNAITGSRDAPIILIVEKDLTINSNSDFYGIAFAFGDVSVNGTATVHGSLISEEATNLTNGGYTQVYDAYVHQQLVDDLTYVDLAKQKYSWIDIKP